MNIQIDEYGRVLETEQSLIESIYNDSMDIQANGEVVDRFNHLCEVFDMLDSRISSLESINCTPEEYHTERQNEWLIPEEYQVLDIEALVFSRCKTDEEILRVDFEISIFKELGLLGVLRAIKYVVDTMDANSFVRGVGRGSSVASYCLFLLGVHMVDSLKYDLPFSEFLSVVK